MPVAFGFAACMNVTQFAAIKPVIAAAVDHELIGFEMDCIGYLANRGGKG